MARQTILVDKDLFLTTIVKVEDRNTFSNFYALYVAVADEYNKQVSPPYGKITHSVVLLRIKEWGIITKTTKGARGRQVGTVIVKRDKTPSELKLGPSKSKGLRHRVITTPSGKCPIPLSGVSKEDVDNWVIKLTEYGESHGIRYTQSAIRYYIRQFYPIGSVEYEKVCDLLGE